MRFSRCKEYGATAAAAGPCARGSRLRRGCHSARSAGASHRALAGHAPHRAWEWSGPVAMGRGTHLRLAQSVSPPARPVRQAGRHPRGVPLARVRADLLAVAAQDVEGRLKPMPAFPALVRQKAVLLWKSRPYGCLAAFRGAGHGNRSTLRRICVSVRRSTSASLRGHQHGHAEDDRALILVRDVSQVPLRVDKEAERLAGETPHDADLKTQRQ